MEVPLLLLLKQVPLPAYFALYDQPKRTPRPVHGMHRLRNFIATPCRRLLPLFRPDRLDQPFDRGILVSCERPENLIPLQVINEFRLIGGAVGPIESNPLPLRNPLLALAIKLSMSRSR